MDGIVALLLSKKFTKDTVIGMGAIKGAPCQVQSINKVGKTTTITLKWEDNVGGTHTQAFDVEDGADGVSVTGATINASGHLILTLSDTNTIDCGQVLPQYNTMPTPSASNEGQILQYIGTTTSSFTNGYFYICESDGLGGYRWVQKPVQDSYTKTEIGDLTNLPDSTKNVVQNINELKLSVDQLGASKLSISNIDDTLSENSENPVQNKVIKLTIDQLRGSILDALADKEDRFRFAIMPNASDYVGKMVQYIGTTDTSYTKGYFYESIEVSAGVYNWIQKNVQPSGGSTGGDGVVDGYYNSTDHLFYEEAGYINPIAGDNNTLYVSLDTNLLYRYNGLIFIRVDEATSGEDDVIDGYYKEADGKFYEEPTYTTEIIGETGKIYISDDTNIQYRWDGTQFVTISSSIDVDNALSTTSENPVQNKVITARINDLEGSKLSLSDVDNALSGTSLYPVQNKVISLKIDQLQGSILEKIQKKLSATADDFVVFTNDGDIADSGISKDVVPLTASASNKLLVASDLSIKADKVVGATNDDIALLDGTGNLKDSNKKLSDYQEKLTDGNGIDIDASNNISLDLTYLTASRVGYIPSSEKGSNNGVAELDSTGKVPSSQLPSYVDDVIEGYLDSGTFYEDSAYTIPITPESGKIYVDLTTNTTYRWSGTAYVQISESLALGTTHTTAYYGDLGKTAYDHSQITNGTNPHNTTADNINLKVPIPALSGSKLDVESTLYGVNTALGTKADKVANATSGHLAGLDGNGNLTDSGVVADDVYVTTDTAETTIDDADYFPFYDTSATGKRKTLFSSIVNKLKTTFATLVTGTFTSGNLVSLDSSGNIADSGKKASDFVGTSDIYKSIKVNNTGSIGSTAKYIKIANAYPTSLVNALVYNISAGYGDSEILTLSTKQDNTCQTPVLNLITRTNIARLSELKYDTNGDIYIRIDAYTTATVTQIAGATIASFSVSLINVSNLPLTVTDGIIINSVNKIDKVSTAIQNDIAIFDANGGVADSGKKLSDLVLQWTQAGS